MLLTRPLTRRQTRFVKEYLTHLDGAAAARAAGYGPKQPERQAFKLLRDPRIQELIKEGITARNERLLLTEDAVIARLIREADDRSENATHSARVQALHLLAKHMNLFRENQAAAPVQFTFQLGESSRAPSIEVRPCPASSNRLLEFDDGDEEE